MKIAIVVQRYGADINGGAEQHARYIAEHLSKHVQVEVLTTCATEYIRWRNALPAGEDVIHGVPVRRFPVTRERDPEEFGRHSDRVFQNLHALGDELAWLDAEGPTSPALIDYIRTHDSEFDFFIFFSFRYYHSFHGIRAVPGKSILVPTAERDGALGLSLFPALFRGVRALMYNSFEERALINAASNNADTPGVVVGVGSEIPAQISASRFRQAFKLRERFAIYIGRIDENKGCAELFAFFQRYARTFAEGLHLVLIGNPIIPIPRDPRIHHLGFLNDQDKFDALAAAELLIMPSYFESLSMVALEAWALGKPVLANGRCDVLKGQCIRSNGGLYYDNFAEFLEALRAIDSSMTLAGALGRAGRDYFSQQYAWPIVERKYLDMFDRLKRETSTRVIEPLPGWFARRRKTVPPADEVVARLPRGAVLERERPERRSAPPVPRPVPAETAAPARQSSPRFAAARENERPATMPSAAPAPANVRSRDTGDRTRSSQQRSRGDGAARGPQRRRRPSGRPPRRPRS
jgi:glycosyltransferase involved in cell wall biosynthesis